MADKRNPLLPRIAAPNDNPLSASDVYEYNAPVVADAWRAAQTQDFWREAAQQYANALLGGSVAPAMKGIRAYHASPNAFDQFDLGRIGSGQGEAAFGHGVYLTSQRKAADGWLKEVASRENPGFVYQTTLDIRPDQLIDWHKPLSSQSKSVSAGLRQSGLLDEAAPWFQSQGIKNPTLQDLYDYYHSDYMPLSDLSRRLNDAGVHGVSFMDYPPSSRSLNREYLIFDPQKIKIVSRAQK